MSESRENTIILTSAANVGVGLWTSICVVFAAIFGVESINFKRKQNIVMNKIKQDLANQMKMYPEYEFSDFRIVKEGNLSCYGTVVGIKKQVEEEPVPVIKETPKEETKVVPINELDMSLFVDYKVGSKVTNIVEIEDDRGTTIKVGNIFEVIKNSKTTCDLMCVKRKTKCTSVDKRFLEEYSR